MNPRAYSTDRSDSFQAATLFEHMKACQNQKRPAVCIGKSVLTYGRLIDLIDSTAREIVASGLLPGDRVLVVLPNSVEHIVAVLAVMAAGGIAVPTSPDIGPRRLSFLDHDASPSLCLIQQDAPAPQGTRTVRLRFDPSARRIDCSAAAGESNPAAGATVSGAEACAALIRYSSGSSGRPKGVVLGHRQLLWSARTLSKIFALDEDHRELMVASMAYSGGWQRVAATLYAGGCLLLPQGPLSVTGILVEIENFAATGFFTPPPLVHMMLASPADKVRLALAGCRTIEIGSAPLAAGELERFMRRAPGARIFVHYGMTECSRALILDAVASPGKRHTVGRPTPGVEIAIRADDGRPLTVGQTGEIMLRGPQLADAYWNRPDLKTARFVDGWLATGDYGMLDEDGFLRFIGRRDDMITCGGHSFFCAEVETELGAVEGVAQYLIAGIPDPRGVLGQVPWAFVVPAEREGWSPRHFLARARERLAPHMVPRWVVTVPIDLPLTPSGKPDRRLTVERYASEALPQTNEA